MLKQQGTPGAALDEAFAAGQAGNRYFDESAPLGSRKDDLVRCDVSIAVTLQIVRQLVVMLAPVVPFSMTKVWGWLGMETDLHRGGWAEGWPEPLQPRATGVDSADPASRAVV